MRNQVSTLRDLVSAILILDGLKSVLRHIVLILLLGSLQVDGATVVLPGRPTAAELAFAATLTNALATTNIAALISLSHCEADEPWAVQWFYASLLKHPFDEIRIERAEAKNTAQYANQLSDDRADLPLDWLVVLRQPPLPFEATGTNLTVLPASLFDGNIVITRRMAVFSPSQKRLLVEGAALAGLLAVWYVAKFFRLRRREGQLRRYAPAGLSILLLFFAGECLAIVYAMSWFAPHPLCLLILPGVGLLACFGAMLYDERTKAVAAGARGLRPNSPGAALVNAWKAWRNQQGPFASPQVRGAVLVAVTLIAIWLGASLWRGTSITLYAQHVQGTVTRCYRRGGVDYTYSVDGRQFSGSAVGSFDRIYPVGSPLDVKYSSAHPAYSTIDDDPFLTLKQLAFGAVLMGGFILLASRKRAA